MIKGQFFLEGSGKNPWEMKKVQGRRRMAGGLCIKQPDLLRLELRSSAKWGAWVASKTFGKSITREIN